LLCGVWQAGAAEFESAPAEPEGMTALFNGRDLTGWDGDPRLWSVRDGVIRGATTPECSAKGNTFLICTAGTFRDFDLRLAFRCNAANNSGIQYRSSRIETAPEAANRWRLRGYQHEIRNEVRMPNVSGFIYDEGGKRSRICLAGEEAVRDADGTKRVTRRLITDEEFAALFRLDQWNEVVIRAQGNRIRHYLNGRLILDFTDAPEQALREGLLGLQLHGGKPMWAEFRDLRIKRLE